MTVAHVAVRLVLALAYGLAVAIVYRVSHGREEGSSSTLFTTLVLLCVLISMVSMVIGSNVARAFSLVGALSIVRFRTVVDDTRDTAFVIFSVIVGMSVGSGLILIPLLAIPIVGAASVLLSRLPASNGEGRMASCRLVLRLALGHDPASLSPIFEKHAQSIDLKGTATARQGVALDLTYHARLRRETTLLAFVTDLNRVEGVMSVELSEP